MIARVATLTARGGPRLTPLWFTVYGDRLYMNARLQSPAVRDMLQHPEVVVLFRDRRGRPARRVLRVRGRAAIRTDRGATAMSYIKAALKYHLSPGGLSNLWRSLETIPVRAAYYGERRAESGVIEITLDSFEFLPAMPGQDL
jgi:hypothetical protein